jgi:small subunit ribosomal protein S16
MVKIRLSRIGAKGQPYYRVVVVDSRRKRDTKVIETIGHYNPRTEPSSFDIKKDRLEYWRGVGAQLTEPVAVLLGEIEPKKHRPKNVKEESQAPASVESKVVEEAEGSKAATAPEESPMASPELAKTIDASEVAAATATPEEIEQTVERTEGSALDVQVAEERVPTTQEEKADTAEVNQNSDDAIEQK